MSHLANNAESSYFKVESVCHEFRMMQSWSGFTRFLADKPLAEVSIQHEEHHYSLNDPLSRSSRLSAASPEFAEGFTKLLQEEHARSAARLAELEARMAAWE